MNQQDISPVHQIVSDHLQHADYILALVGAGLSASSGIPTFSGSGKTWRGFEAKDLATPEMFVAKPQVVWRYYSEFRQTMNATRPNRGHGALALLAREKPGFFCVTQNIDDLSQRAGHPLHRLAALHGSVSTLKCFDEGCTFSTPSSALTLPTSYSNEPLTSEDIESLPMPPTCPSCREAYLRPDVTWFGEFLNEDTTTKIDAWIRSVPCIDVMLVIGTTADLARSAEFISTAADMGATVVHINVEITDNIEDGDLCLLGDAAEILPIVVGEALGLNLSD